MIMNEDQREKLVKAKDMVTVFGTGANAHMPLGEEYSVHSNQAKLLIDKGAATLEAPEGVTPKKKKGKKDE
jgi:hypothetical protein